MVSIRACNLDGVDTWLRKRAVGSGRSLEEEARLIRPEAVGRKLSSDNLASVVRAHFGSSNGVDLKAPCKPVCEPPRFA